MNQGIPYADRGPSPHSFWKQARTRYLRPALITLALGIVCWAGANSINYVSHLRPGPDAGEYAAAGMMSREGKVLYTDIIEFKPPMTFVLNRLALSVGDGTFHSIRILERFVAGACGVLFFFIILTVFGRPLLALVMALGFLLYNYRIIPFEEGNITEEYAVMFALAGTLCALLSRVREGRAASLLIGLAGACFSCATLTKEPFIFSSVAWFLYAVVRKGGGLGGALRGTAVFVSGALIPFGVFLAYLVGNGALIAWLDSTHLSYVYATLSELPGSFLDRQTRSLERFAVTVFNATYAGRIAFAMVVAGCLLFPRFLRKHHYLPLLALFALLMDFVGATTSQRLYGHYFVQTVPSFLLCCAFGGAFAARAFRVFGSRNRVAVLLALLLLVMDQRAIAEFWTRLQQPFVRADVGPISHFIRAHERDGDDLWIQAGHNSRYYVETGLTSPAQYFLLFPAFFLDTWQSTGQEKLAELEKVLVQRQPAWMVLSGRQKGYAAYLSSIGYLDWICSSYTLVPMVRETRNGYHAFLYARNDRARMLALSGVHPVAHDAPCSNE